jgi:hypothetical protein
MKCDVFHCQKILQEADLVLVDLQGINPKTMQPQKIHMMVPVCTDCLNKYKGGYRVKGHVKILEQNA